MKGKWAMRLVGPAAAAAAVLALASGSALAASGSGGGGGDDVGGPRQEAKISLAGGPAKVELRLEAGELSAKAVINGGLTPGVRYSLCVDGMLVDDEVADNQGRTSMEDNIGWEGDLAGAQVSIHSNEQAAGCDGPVVMSGEA